MRARSLLNFFLFPCFFMKIITTFTASEDLSACSLSFLYEPEGECLHPMEEIKLLDSIPSNRCCRTVLNTLSQALARQARDKDNIFLPSSQWQQCKLPVPQTSSISIKSCGFENLHQGINKCSDLTISYLRLTNYLPEYNMLFGSCSQFPHPSFDQACRNCTEGIKIARDQLINQLLLDNTDEDMGMCGLALVILVAAAKMDDPLWVKDFYGCLPALDRKADHLNYFKLNKSLAKVIIAILITVMGFVLVLVLAKYLYKKKKPEKPQEGGTTCTGLYRFSREEITSAMDSSNKVRLGSGSVGRVYKGVLPSRQVVAIKHIYKSGISESFRGEVDCLSRIRHPTLVCLFGFCMDDGELFLVYEYCPYGNLAQQLLRKDSVLSWDKRVKILRDSALALRFLHSYPEGRIVHRNIKLTNILLTENLEPKLSDFGLAKMLGMDESKVFTDVKGTTGYMDPEYVRNSKLTCASDVYSFGIVTLQILSGKGITELDLDARNHLTEEAKDVISGKLPLLHFGDPRLTGNLNEAAFYSILNVAVLCVADSSRWRPTMHVIFEELDKVWQNTVQNVTVQNVMGRVKSEFNSSSTEIIEV